MKLISTEIVAINQVCSYLKKIFAERYQIQKSILESSAGMIENYLKHFRENLYTLVEYPYVDKIYRDSYYLYYSTKNKQYSRDCIRLSFFDKSLEHSDFDNPNSFDHIQTSYLGFIVLRPTFPQIIGRSIVSPNAVKNNKFRICSVKVDVTSNGLKTSVSGFPHASQDGETITCAETSILNVMEYFGLKYPEYSPILPSKIKSVVESQSFERTLPSVGLNLSQMSYVLREFGFGVKMYLKELSHSKLDFTGNIMHFLIVSYCITI